jgi:hypothetical protein
MLRGPLHNRGADDGNCSECGEPFPCPTGLAIYEAVKRALEQPTRFSCSGVGAGSLSARRTRRWLARAATRRSSLLSGGRVSSAAVGAGLDLEPAFRSCVARQAIRALLPMNTAAGGPWRSLPHVNAREPSVAQVFDRAVRRPLPNTGGVRQDLAHRDRGFGVGAECSPVVGNRRVIQMRPRSASRWMAVATTPLRHEEHASSVSPSTAR